MTTAVWPFLRQVGSSHTVCSNRVGVFPIADHRTDRGLFLEVIRITVDGQLHGAMRHEVIQQRSRDRMQP